MKYKKKFMYLKAGVPFSYQTSLFLKTTTGHAVNLESGAVVSIKPETPCEVLDTAKIGSYLRKILAQKDAN